MSAQAQLSRPAKLAGHRAAPWVTPESCPKSGQARERWFTVPEAVAYDMAGEVIGGPAGAPESGTAA
jgi:hypothetical protein